MTGRLTDASLVVGPAIAHHGWTQGDVAAFAGATVAGHVLECGAQPTGGTFAFFTELLDGGRHPGFRSPSWPRTGPGLWARPTARTPGCRRS